MPGTRRYARAHQRARPHRVGRFFDRDTRGRRGRRHHVDRDAAQQHSGNYHGRRVSAKSSPPPRANLWVDVGFWGGVVPGNVARAAPAVGSRRIRLQVLPGTERRRGIRARHRGPICARAAGTGRARRASARSRGIAGSDRRSRRESREECVGPPQICHVARVPPARCGKRGDRSVAAAEPRVQRARSHRASVFVGCASATAAAAKSRARKSASRLARTT